jgi:RNA polymerase sigma-70 factor (ECF subfamily)
MEARFESRLAAMQPRLFRLALALTGNEDEASDMVQETFVKALRGRAGFAEDSNLSGWLARILRNALLDRRRYARRRPFAANLDDLQPADRPRTFEGMEGTLRVELDRLPSAQRAMVLLSDVHGFTYREISELLDRPMGTVMSGIHRARRRLRRALQGTALAAA